MEVYSWENHLFLWAIYTMAMLNNQRVSQRHPEMLMFFVVMLGWPCQDQRFQSQFAGRLVEKEYLCLCEADSTVARRGMRRWGRQDPRELVTWVPET